MQNPPLLSEESPIDSLPDEPSELPLIKAEKNTEFALSFETMLDKLSEQLDFKNREKLGGFVRKAIQIVLDTFLREPYQGTTPEQVKYRVVNSSRFEVNAEIDILTENGRGMKELCSLGLKENSFLGIPDGTPKLSNLKDLPPLVKRQRVLIKDIRPREGAIWLGRNYLKRKAKQCEDKDLVIDLQIQ